mgnify:FL=1|jgi:glycosyltransferase involved in cell wall biosynthesis
MIKILVVYHYFPHYRLPVLKALSNQENVDLEYTFLSGSTADIPINILMKADFTGLNFISVKNRWFFGKILWQTKVLWYSISDQYDCVVYLGNPNFTTTWLGAFFARVIGKPVLFWTHGFLKTKSFSDKIRKIFFRIPNALLLYGNKAKDNLISRGFNVDRLFVIYNSLDFENQIKIKQTINEKDVFKLKCKLFKNPNLPVLIFIGRLTQQKKLLDIIEVTQMLHNEGIPVNVLFVGDGAMREELIKSIELKLLSDYFTFFGECHKEEQLAQLITLSDLCVSPGEVGLTAIHSLVYGTPVVTHDSEKFQMPEYEAVVDGVTGGLYEFNSLDSLFLKVKEWLIKDNLQEIKDNCFKMINDYYNPKVQVKLINRAIKKILDEK